MFALRARRADRVRPKPRKAARAGGAAARKPRGGARKARRLLPRLARLPGRRTARAAAMLALLGAGALAWQTGAAARGLAALRAAAVDAGAAAGLTVREVTLEGRRHASPDELRAALGVAVGDAILPIDPAAARARLERHPWVASARVERRLPDTLHIAIVERRPVALWQRGGAIGVVDAEGRVLTERGLEAFSALPLVVGVGAPGALPALAAAIAADPGLYSRLSAASWVGERRWTLRFDDRVDVLLPEGPPAPAWARLSALQRRSGILDAGVARIDLRGADRVLVRLDESAAAADSGT